MPTQCMQSAISVPTTSCVEVTAHSADMAPTFTFFRRVAFLALFCLIAMCTFGQTVTVTVGSNGVATIVYTPPANTTAPPVVVTSTPPAVTIAASPTAVAPGGTTTISYTLSNATSATFAIGSVSGAVTATSNSVAVTPAATTTYTITGTNSMGSVSKSVTVSVAPAGVALTSCGDITAAGSYFLANDVSSAGTCFGIDANNITLNLNNHTITYGTGGGNAPTPAIEGHDCWSTSNPVDSGPCGSAHGGLVVYGGKIVQSSSSAAFSPVFSFGQGTFSSAPYIHDIVATFQNAGAQFYYSNYIVTGAKIINNTIYDNVTSINKTGQSDLSARAAFQGQAIYINQNNNNPGVGDQIENNTIVGSPQGGVRTVNQNSVISGNDISMNATYSNDFCADVPADSTTVTNNNCHPKSGRGFHVNANKVLVTNNKINVIELSQNAEYKGCEGGGTYGVQVEFDSSFLPSAPTGVQVTGNTITATSVACKAIGLRVTGMTPAGNAVFSGNTITTTSTGTAQDFGISTDGSNNQGVSFTSNTFSDKYAYADGEWDGFSNTLIGHNTWLGTPSYTFVAVDGGCDPSQTDAGAVCPANVTFTDSLPNTVVCGSYSEAAVSINGQVTQCKAKQ
ncbi:MAG: hypothetical protein V4587_00835 [Acidobacteriota bacterium]